MHKVKRNSPPPELVEKDRQWKEYLTQNPDAEHGWDNLSRELKDKIKNSLREMYAECCCYCESQFEDSSWAHIEHFKPKKYFKELCYDYNNMHYCCQQCNTIKKDTVWDGMFSPTEEDPELYIKYKGYMAVEKDKEGRGREMINVLKLNERRVLENKRAKYLQEISKEYKKMLSFVRMFKQSQLDLTLLKPHIESFIADIEEESQHGEKYCTMIKHNFGRRIAKWKEKCHINHDEEDNP